MMDPLLEEVVPDSRTASIEELSQSILGNLSNIFLPAVDNETQCYSISDSQETHLSLEDAASPSEDIAMIAHTPIEKYTPIVDTALQKPSVSPKLPESVQRDISTESRQLTTSQDTLGLILVTESQTMDANEETTVESDMTQLDSSVPVVEIAMEKSPEEELPDWIARYKEVTTELEEAQQMISELSEKVSSTSDFTEISETEGKSRRKIAKIVGINKKEKEELITFKKSGGKVSKEQLLALAKCHRKSLSVVQLQKACSEKIEQNRQLQQEIVFTPAMECSQSLLPNCTITESNSLYRVFLQPTCLPPSILKNSRSAAENAELGESCGSSTPRKVVKFHIPYKEKNVSSGDDCFTQAAAVADSQDGAKSNGVDMADLFGGKMVHVAQKNNTSDVCAALTTHQTRRGEGILNTIPDPTAILEPLSVTSESLMDVNNSNENESIESISLISGISGVEATQFTHPIRPFPHILKPMMRPPQQEATLRMPIGARPLAQIFRPPHLISSQSQQIPGIRQGLRKTTPFSSTLPNSEVLLNLSEMARRGMVSPGQGVLKYNSQGKTFSASLLHDGLLQGAGGEIFPSPMTWLKALSGAKCAPPRMKAYQSITCEGKSLYQICINASINLSLHSTRTLTAASSTIRLQTQQPTETGVVALTTRAVQSRDIETTLVSSWKLEGPCGHRVNRSRAALPGLARVTFPPQRVDLSSLHSFTASTKENRPIERQSDRMPMQRFPASTKENRPIEQQRVQLVQDDEFCKISRAFPGFVWEDSQIYVPNNIEQFFF